MTEQNEKSLFEYVDILRRRKWYFIISFPVLFFISVIVALSLPAVYRSQAVILISSQEIPSDLVRTTVTSYAEQQIQIIQQRIMTTAQVQEIINKYNLYPELRQTASPTQLVGTFRSNVNVNMVNARVLEGGRARTANIAFRVSFYDQTPAKAQAVANELVTIFLSENVRSRTDKAAETSAFLREEANRIRTRVQLLEERIAEFKAEFSDSLPELLNFNLAGVQRAEERLVALQNQEVQINEQIAALNLELSILEANSAGTGNLPASGPARLAALQEQLTLLSNRYAPAHPDIVQLKREIAQLEQSVQSGEPAATSSAAQQTPRYLQVKLQVETLQRDLERLRIQQQQQNQELQNYRDRVARTPQVQRGYADLTRDYQSELAKYQELRSKEMQADIAQNLETENKAESFALLEPPGLPTEPEKPNRPKIMAMGFVLSGAFGVGLMILVEMLNLKVRGDKAVARITGVSSLVVVPAIQTRQEIQARKKRHRNYFFAVILLLVIAVVVVHFMVMSLDMVWFKVLDRINLL